MDTKESPVGVVASWSALAASFVLSFATWVALAEMAGFTGTATVAGFTVHLSWMMAVAVDGYVVSALVAWMAPVSEEIAKFAKANTYAGAAVGVVAQSAYHGLSAQYAAGDEWKAYLAAVVGALPPLAAGLSVHLRALVRRASMSKPSAVQPDMDMVARAWTPAPAMDSLDTDELEPLTDTDKAVLSSPVPDTVAALVDKVPAPRRPRPASGWKVSALEMIRTGEPATDREIAEKILADHPETWATVEAGRKAVSRLRSAV